MIHAFILIYNRKGVPKNETPFSLMTNIKSNCVFVMPLHFKAISHSPYRLDILWMRRVIFDFLPNLLNMHCHSRDIYYRLHIPDLAKQLFFVYT